MALETPMQALLECARQALITAGRPAGLVRLEPGAESVWDGCCEGQLYVRLGTILPGPVQGNCGVVTATSTMFLGIVRCAATVDDNFNPPSAAVMTAEAIVIVHDMETLLDAIQCCDWKSSNTTARVQNWNPITEGDCAGGEWQIDVTYGLSCGCDG